MNLIQNSKFQSRRLDDQEQGLQRPHDKMIRYYTEDQMQGQRLDRIRGNIEERGEGGELFPVFGCRIANVMCLLPPTKEQAAGRT